MNLTPEIKNNALMNLEELLEVFEDLTIQHCMCGGKLDSMAMGTNADAIRMLDKLGLATIERESGRRVIAKIGKEQT